MKDEKKQGNGDQNNEFFEDLTGLDIFFLDENTNYFENKEIGEGSIWNRKKESLSHRNEEFKRNLKKWLTQQRMNIRNQIKTHRNVIRENINDPDFVMTIDKISFVTGVLIIMLTEAFLFLCPSRIPILYTTLLIPLLLMRYYLYRKDKMHYYMYDFCYYQQLLVLLQIHKFPENEFLFKVNFGLTTGPIAIAVILWRNSLVFHSIDKMTSAMIHILPSVVMFSMRWENNLLHHKFPLWESDSSSTSQAMNTTVTNAIINHIIDFVCYPFAFYLIWQCLYLFKTEVISYKKLSNDTELMTSLRYLQRYATNTRTFKIINELFGPNHMLIGFVSYQGVYTIATLLPVSIFWHSMRIHTLYLSLIFIQALINGASYYFQIFASRYIEDLQKKSGKEFKATSSK